MLENGAKSVRAIASHAVMSDPASTRVDQSALAEMIFTDLFLTLRNARK